MKTHKSNLSSKFDNVLSTFFSEQLDQQLALYQNLLGLWHSYIDPQIIWTSPSLYWKRLFMKTHKSDLSSKFDNVLSTFFSDQLDQQLFLYQNLLELWHSYIDPQIIWTSPSLYWKRLFMKTHKSNLSSKFDNVLSTFFSDQLDQQLALYQNLLGLWHSYIDPQIIWTSPSL